MSALLCLLALGLQQAPATETAFVSDVKVIQPGVPFTVALKMKMAPGWHSYYENPGDAGQATAIKWKLPAGFTAGPIQWPVPERIDFEGIFSFVYENELWLLNTITPPKTLKPGMKVHISAHVGWLLCSTGCVPQSSDLTLDLASGAKVQPDASLATKFAQVRAELPALAKGFTISASLGKPKAVRLMVTGNSSSPEGVRFVPADADAFGANEAKVSKSEKGLALDIALSQYAKTAPTRVKGILVLPAGAGIKAYIVDVPVLMLK